MKITIIIVGILFIYAAFSTLFYATGLVGNIGEKIAETNFLLFGHLAYVNIFVLFYPLYKIYTDKKAKVSLDFYLGWILFFIALILLYALILEPNNVGLIGGYIVEFLNPYIGKAGLWLFLLMIVSLSLVFILDDDFKFTMPKKEKSIKNNVKKQQTKKRPKKEKKPSKIGKFFSSISDKIKNIFKNPFSYPLQVDESISMTSPYIDTQIDKIDKVEKIDKKVEDTKKIDITEIIIEEKIEEKIEEEQIIMSNIDTDEDNMAPIEEIASTNIVKELAENSKLMDQLDKGILEKPKNFTLPPLEFLQKPPPATKKINELEIDRKSGELLEKLRHFNINGDVVRTYTGPLVTTFEFKPAANVKVSKILSLQDDLAMALSAETIRIQAPIPGRDVVGIEIPNESSDIIFLRDIIDSELFQNSKSPLTIALGKDIVGNPFITDIKKLPHLLIAGTTGSGKSVGINAMILSLLYRNDPDQLKLMMIDPKMLEFSIYDGIPHLITPVITEPKKAIAALTNMVGEMERRYMLMAKKRTKNIDNYNEKVKIDESADPMPFIVIIIDELADLMMNGGKEVELSIARLAQKSRACGIHLVVATQRPSVDVVTGIIKANLPSRLSYRVSQKIDSKVILDAQGADSLLGRGDGLFTPPGTTGLVRIHAPWATEDEIDKIVEFLKDQGEPNYDESYLIVGGGTENIKNETLNLDELYEDAKSIVLNDNKTSISYLQRKLSIGYNRSANIIEQLQSTGVLSEPNAKGNREIL